jgi:hypothetical protein
MGPMGWTSTVVDHQALAPFAPFGQVGMARVDRAARVAKGQRGGGNRTQCGHFEISDNFFSSRSRSSTCNDCSSSN